MICVDDVDDVDNVDVGVDDVDDDNYLILMMPIM